MYILYAFVALALILLALSGTIMSRVKEPKFTVIESQDNIEIREYTPVIVAEVLVDGERQKAISNGFRILAEYIFGNNVTQRKIPMTAPVTQQLGEKIAMTAPVIQQETGGKGRWKVRFMMPQDYTLQTIPKPSDKQVELSMVPAKRYAVIRFSGLAGSDSLLKHQEELGKYMASKHLKGLGEPVFAFYNPPWTLPFLRRNEIMVELAE